MVAANLRQVSRIKAVHLPNVSTAIAGPPLLFLGKAQLTRVEIFSRSVEGGVTTNGRLCVGRVSHAADVVAGVPLNAVTDFPRG